MTEKLMSNHAISRRDFLKGTAAFGIAAGTTTLYAPYVKAAAGQIVVRGLGGAYEAAMMKAVYEPFTAETGIKVAVQPATAAQIRAMVEAKRVRIDVVDLLDVAQLSLDRIGALDAIAYDKMTYTRPDDIQASVRRPNMVGNLFFATVLVYNTEVFPAGAHPKGWSQFWDVKRFPGARTLADQKSGAAELEFALLADGVAKDALYPLDVDRAFKSLGRIKSSVVKWWDTGAVSAQMLELKEAVIGGIWNGRAQALIDNGAPLAIDWTEAKQQVQYWGIVKGAQNSENAQRFIDFALQPEVQGNLTQVIAYGPTNTKAFEYVRPEDLAKLPSAPDYFPLTFQQNPEWWTDHLSEIGSRWQAWVLSK
ncbi:ABC transporter substrate-binding protein [Microvirga sp. VF16]|uniref:ABC transporter substrate-binding protein n=1 Tax=Microvirga sp. VF16 TaxID=2807101 RepID=UPI00193EBE02|nr:ABC transporter substrate-binding protein [Microvirga sp. VF16]QRM33071.1 ABC transporter substrate-binding protein [Microvirga sp. VF16]